MQKSNEPSPLEGGCDCKSIRYRMVSPPLIVNSCHCRWCQRKTGSAFLLNAMIEANRVAAISSSAPELVNTPSESGREQLIAGCPNCRIAVWSQYSSPLFRFVRVGTLDDPGRCPPDVHIFTASKQRWVRLETGIPVAEADCEREDVWSEESLERLEEVRKIAGEVGD